MRVVPFLCVERTIIPYVLRQWEYSGIPVCGLRSGSRGSAGRELYPWSLYCRVEGPDGNVWDGLLGTALGSQFSYLPPSNIQELCICSGITSSGGSPSQIEGGRQQVSVPSFSRYLRVRLWGLQYAMARVAVFCLGHQTNGIRKPVCDAHNE